MTESGEDTARHATGGFLAERALTRPLDDRKVAGVCAGLGRFTGTDPLLWRVTLGALIVVYGAGLVLYVVGWLLIPSEGDETSALESLFTRKSSSVPKLSTVAMAVAALTLCVITFAGSGGRPFVIFGLMVLVIAVLARRRDQLRAPAPPVYPAPFPATGPYARSSQTVELPVPAPTPPHPGTIGVTPPPAMPPPQVPPPPIPPPVPAVAAQPPKRPREPRSRFGLVMGSFTVIVVSALAIAAMQGAPISLGAILAVGLLMCGGGLLVATWWGRARGLILLGLPMAMVLAVYGLVFSVPDVDAFQDRRIVATTVEEIPPRVATAAGMTTVSLSDVEFEDDDVATMDVEVRGALVRIHVPENLDVVVDTELVGGELIVDEKPVAPMSLPETFPGPDGEGGGQLVLTGHVYPGAVEVTR